MKEMISYGRFKCPELSPHKNRGMEITYIEKGNLEWMVEGVPEKLSAGSIFFTLPWQAHGSLNPREPDNTICHVLFHLAEDYMHPREHFAFTDTLGFSPKEMKAVSKALCASEQHAFRATPAMRWLMPALINELQSDHKLSTAHTVTLLRGVIIELFRIVSGEAVDIETHTESERKAQRLLQQLSAECGQNWTLKRMAEICGIQRTQLNNIVQKITGCTPMEYLARLRMERAKTLLRETDMKVIDVAFECGFSSSQYFANTFRQSTGLTPSEYRKLCINPADKELQKWKELSFRSESEEKTRIKRYISSADPTEL